MRLNALHLIRYGNFEDAEIVFPVPARDTPDVTVVYGPNEAGKSTAFHALLDIFFGFRAGAHPYAFRFERVRRQIIWDIRACFRLEALAHP